MHTAQEQRDDLWLVLPHLGPGGAQKVALLAASFFGLKGWRHDGSFKGRRIRWDKTFHD